MINLNESEKLLKAKSYLDKLANGINPITNELASENDTINNIHISRCLFYVSDVLRNLIENNNNPQKKKNSKIPFSVTPQQLADYVFDDNPITVTEITKKLNSLIDTEEMKGIKTTSITNWLIKINMLEYLPTKTVKIIKSQLKTVFNSASQHRNAWVCTVHIKSFYMTAMSNNLYLTI